jgi:hypothetical protein
VKALIWVALLLSACVAQSNKGEEFAASTDGTTLSALAANGAASEALTIPAELTAKPHPLECSACTGDASCTDSVCGLKCKAQPMFNGVCGRYDP